jgi:hypothetical protein
MLLSPRFLFSSLSLLASITVSPLVAQTLQLSSASASPGTGVVIEISLKSPQGKEPAALQWEATIPSSQLNLVDKQITAGPAAQEAGKSVACALKGRTDQTVTSVCILAGGQREIRDGVVATLILKVPQEAPIGPAWIRLERAIAVSAGATEVPIESVKSKISISRR